MRSLLSLPQAEQTRVSGWGHFSLALEIFHHLGKLLQDLHIKGCRSHLLQEMPCGFLCVLRFMYHQYKYNWLGLLLLSSLAWKLSQMPALRYTADVKKTFLPVNTSEENTKNHESKLKSFNLHNTLFTGNT